MYLWNVKECAEALRENKISPSQTKLCFFHLLGAWLIPIGLAAGKVISITWLAAATAIALALLGIYLARQAVASGDGKDFFHRFVCLALPASLKIEVLAAAVYAAVYFAAPSVLASFWFSLVFWSLIPVLLFRKLNPLLKWVAELKPSFVARQGI